MHSKWKKLIEWERRKAVYSLLFLCIDDVDVLFGMSCTGVTGQRSGGLDVGTAGHQVGDEGMAGTVERNMLADAGFAGPFVQHTQAVGVRREAEYPFFAQSGLYLQQVEGTGVQIQAAQTAHT